MMENKEEEKEIVYKTVYRRETPSYFVLIRIIYFILIGVVVANYFIESISSEFIKNNIAVIILIFIISAFGISKLKKKFYLFEYNDNSIKDYRRNIELDYEKIVESRIELLDREKNDLVGLTIDNMSDKNYVLFFNTDRKKNLFILLGNINKRELRHIKRILKKKLNDKFKDIKKNSKK